MPIHEEPMEASILKQDETTDQENEGRDYPFDIWFLISRYIRPEDIGRFAALCRSSYSVLNTMQFWTELYYRFYNVEKDDQLPVTLQPVNIRRAISYRMNVIRAVYLMYPPFRERSVAIVPNIHVHPELLIGRTCVLAWQGGTSIRQCHWKYFFKLKLPKKPSVPKQKPIHEVSDIWLNPEEDCKILQLTCLMFVPLLPLESLVLTSAVLRLTDSLTSYRLEMRFEPEVAVAMASGNGSRRHCGVLVLLGPVINLSIMDWWHPKYPHGIISHDVGDAAQEEPQTYWDE